ncbi:MAG TPA: hypothetical protein VGF21_04930 [Thermoleophilaceae bacterium]|jgi:hypothetical protein
MQRPRPLGRWLLAALLALLAAFPAAAFAQSSVLPDDPSLDQYVESLPDAGGHRPPGATGHAAPLPADVRRSLRSTTADRLLRRVATSPQLGAPTVGSSRGADRGARGEGNSRTSDVAKPQTFQSALANTVTDSGGVGIPFILGILAAIFAVMAFAAVRRSRAPTR